MIPRPWAAWGGIVAVALLAAAPALAWERRVRDASSAWAAATTPTGDVFVAIPFPARRHEAKVGVAKLSAQGRERWRRSLAVRAPEHSDEIYGLVVTAEGDVVAGGAIDVASGLEFAAVRLSGRTGRLQWRRIMQGTQRIGAYHEARGIALDPSGDVVLAGTLESATALQYHGTDDLAVVKLAGADGAERWRFVLDGTAQTYDSADRVAVDAAGDVIVAGMVANPAPTVTGYRADVTFMKLAGADGRLLWRTTVGAFVDERSLALDPAGNVLATGTYIAGTSPADFGVLKLDGATGTLRWTAAIDGSTNTWESAFDVVALPSGDVAAVGFTGDYYTRASLTVAAFDGATGAERWRRLIKGTDGWGIGRSIAVGPGGDVIVGGQLRNVESCYDVAVLELSAATGATVMAQVLDGTATATACDAPRDQEPCRGRCPFTGIGIDRDELTSLAIDRNGRIVFSGTLDDGRRGRSHAFAAQLDAAP
ncbi:MAG TPA: PQQ-binding-like beta-propeller repeat protein [Candidatus Eisenbacteria bacterium]|nr:PQQ-binding-like beta-propeller repeat protein [Candidatus Eisenbacteria bacterium]